MAQYYLTVNLSLCIFFSVKPDAALLMENHFSKRLIKPIAITPSNQQDKWVDSSSLLYFMNIPQVVLFYLFCFQLRSLKNQH